MSIPKQEYKDFSLRLHLKCARIPIVGQFELTHRCPLCCQHCYIAQPEDEGRGTRDERRGTRDEGRGTVNREELSYKELCRILDDVHKEGCLWICLTGGEPLLREDFLDIYLYAYKKGFIITIFTSATLLTEKITKFLKKFPPFCIEVTLNGATQKTYELITQTPSSFAQAREGIELIRRYNLPLKLKCQVMTLNVDELSLMQKFSQGMGVEFRCSSIIEPRVDGSTTPCSLRLSAEQRLKFKNSDELPKATYDIEDNFLGEKCLSGQADEILPSSDNSLFRCPGGSWAFYVDPYGRLFFCNSKRKPSWDLRSRSFREGFYEFFPKISSAKFETDSKCRSCKHLSVCLRCPGRAELECGNPEAPIPYYCNLAEAAASTGQSSPKPKDSVVKGDK